jgi:ribosomal-protein-alanine N-acetyltransferase
MQRVQRTMGLELRAKRVTLRPIVAADFEAWSEVRRRCGEWLTRWEPRALVDVSDPAEERRVFLQRIAARERERQLGMGYGFGIFLGGRFVGEINLSSIQRGPFQNSYIGYWIDEAQAGQGLMPEATAAILRFAFDDLRLHRVQISVIPRNASSRRVPEKLGLRDEGTALRYLEINGVWEDHVRYAITAEEWFERSALITAEWLA